MALHKNFISCPFVDRITADRESTIHESALKHTNKDEPLLDCPYPPKVREMTKIEVGHVQTV